MTNKVSDAQFTIGQLLDENAKRDAVHFAVAPQVADKAYTPGEDFNAVGIVDPFLKAPVKQGERFWLFLYPNTITSLRHHWTHPAFPETEAESSKEWMTRWAMEHVSEDYYGDSGKCSEAEAYAFALDLGLTHNLGPYEDARDYIDDTWWHHWEKLTGQQGDRKAYFRCAC